MYMVPLQLLDFLCVEQVLEVMLFFDLDEKALRCVTAAPQLGLCVCVCVLRQSLSCTRRPKDAETTMRVLSGI